MSAGPRVWTCEIDGSSSFSVSREKSFEEVEKGARLSDLKEESGPFQEFVPFSLKGWKVALRPGMGMGNGEWEWRRARARARARATRVVAVKNRNRNRNRNKNRVQVINVMKS
jgi:hypothetical protein